MLVLAVPAAAQAPEAGLASLACTRQLFVAAYPVYLAFRVHGPIDACMADQFVNLADQILQTRSQSVVEPEALRVLIHSEGGSLADAVAMVGAIQRLQEAGIRVVAVVDGVVGGAAVFVRAAADGREVAPLALVALRPRPAERREPSWWQRVLLVGVPPDPLEGWWRRWVEWLADRLGERPEEIRALMDRQANLTGREVVERGWATLAGGNG